ncbi:MAG: hypothetical protein K9K93_04110, partial [Acholeplasmataceae bacterium]|nr:hypothetical protein [Acholeplasmataceae bacterium]
LVLTACELEEDVIPGPGVYPELAEYVEKTSAEEDLAVIPDGGVVYQHDFTVAEPIETFDYVFNGSNMLTYDIEGVGTIESRGFNDEVQLPKVLRQDADGLHFGISRLGDWSGNGEVRLLSLLEENLVVTAGAFYTVEVEVKFLGDGPRPLRMIYAGKDNSNANWGDSANNLEIGSEFVTLKHNEFFLAGVTGSPATINNTTRLDFRLGWMGDLTKQSDVDYTLVVKSLTITRGATSSIHTTTPDGSVRQFTVGGDNVFFDGVFMNMTVSAVAERSQMPAVVFTGLQLLNGVEYQLQFTHSALRRRSVEVFIGYFDDYGRLLPLKDAPDAVVLDSYTSANTETMEFTWEGASFNNAYLVFNYGDVGDYAVTTQVKVGQVSLVQK